MDSGHNSDDLIPFSRLSFFLHFISDIDVCMLKDPSTSAGPCSMTGGPGLTSMPADRVSDEAIRYHDVNTRRSSLRQKWKYVWRELQLRMQMILSTPRLGRELVITKGQQILYKRDG